MHPLQGASFLSTSLQGGILKPPALRVVADFLEKCPVEKCAVSTSGVQGANNTGSTRIPGHVLPRRARLFLTVRLSSGAVAFHRGPGEQHLRDIPLATRVWTKRWNTSMAPYEK